MGMVKRPIKPEMPVEVREFFIRTGSLGGKKRAETHTAEELAAWGRKGGRPKGSGKKTAKKQAEKGAKS